MSQIRIIIVPFTKDEEAIKDILLFKDSSNEYSLLISTIFIDSNIEKSVEETLKNKINVHIKKVFFLGKLINSLDVNQITSIVYACHVDTEDVEDTNKQVATVSIANAINDDDIYLSITATRAYKYAI